MIFSLTNQTSRNPTTSFKFSEKIIIKLLLRADTSIINDMTSNIYISVI